MPRPKDDLPLVVPQLFSPQEQTPKGDRHVYASRTRFIPDRLLGLFEKTSWPLAATGTTARAASQGVRLDVGARMRGMWRWSGTFFWRGGGKFCHRGTGGQNG